MKKKKVILISLACLLLALVIWVIWGNTALECNEVTIQSARLPKAFDGFRIAHISDLHNTELGKNNEKLLHMLKEAKPDIIAITGDMIDSRNTKAEVALAFAKGAMEIAPCYYVTGNHESRVDDAYQELKSGLTELGVVLLSEDAVTLQQGDASISLVGVNDPAFWKCADEASAMDQCLQTLAQNADGFTILLSHRPELFEVYGKNSIDLVLTGHAHGGQFRLPFIGGLVAPNQGFFPEYDAGVYTQGTTNMVVSRGIGNSIIPLRFNNPPEIVLIELQTK